MTKVSCEKLVKRAFHTKILAQKYKIEALDPITLENIKSSKKPLFNGLKALRKHWIRDKKMLRKAHVVIDLTGSAKSEGVATELGYTRFFLYKPIIRVYPGLGPSVARIENDYIVSSAESAIKMAVKLWGTRWKRFIWRLNLLKRCFLRSLWYKLGVWINDWR